MNRTRSHPNRGNAGRVFTLIVPAGMLVAALSAAATADELKVIRSSSGRVMAVTSDSGGPIPLGGAVPRGGTASDLFLERHGAVFGVSDAGNQLMPQKVEADALGTVHRTYQQIHQGLPVFSGVLKIHESAAGGVMAANGDFYAIPEKLNTVPTITLDAAIQNARLVFRSGAPVIEHSELLIVDPGCYGDKPRGARLAYHLILSDPIEPIRDAFFIDAHTGELLDKWSLIETIKDRRIHDANQTSTLPGTLVRSEGQSQMGHVDVNRAYDYFGDTYDYFFRAFGRDSIDGAGMPMIGTVRWLESGTCPNAFWNSVQMVFCLGTVTDDIVGHELTHGVTEHTANLIYQNQSGQINEAMSDIFGELVDLFNGNAAFPGVPGGTPWPTHGTGPGVDAPNNLRTTCSFPTLYGNGVRWLMGEDANAFGGAIRDMWAPNCFGDPDRANSPNMTCTVFDNGGVHIGSGVVNHAFAIMTDGKTFNGQTVTGIGPIKSGAVMYRTLTTYLTVGSDFEDLYWAANQAAADLIGTTPNDPRTGMPSASMFTAADAAEVDKALLAVEMNTPGFCGQTRNILSSAPPPPCASPSAPVYYEDFEAGLGGWTTQQTGSPATSYDWISTTEPLPFGRAGKAAFCDNLSSNCLQNEAALRSLISPVIQLPLGMHFPVLSFHHYMDSEAGFDGGRLRIRVNNEPWDFVPVSSFFYNGYNDRLLTVSQGNNNPIAGGTVFTGSGGQWGTSLVYLTPSLFNATSLQIRFDFGQDFCTGADGWYIDDVQIFDCLSAVDCNNNAIPDDFETAPGPHRDVFVSNPSGHEEGFPSDANDPGSGILVFAQRFSLLVPKAIRTVKIHGYYSGAFDQPTDSFRVIVHRDSSSGAPALMVSSQANVPSTRTPTGHQILNQYDEYEYELTLASAVNLQPGAYWIQIYNNTAMSDTTFNWVFGATTFGSDYCAVALGAPGSFWITLPWNLSLELGGDIVGADSDGDSVPDDCDACPNDPDHVQPGICGCNRPDDPTDLDGDGIPDCVDNCPTVPNPDQKPGLLVNVGAMCDQIVDCNNNDMLDTEDLLFERSKDCNTNGIIDECDPDILSATPPSVITMAAGEVTTLDGYAIFQGGTPPFAFDWTLRGQPGGERSFADKPGFGPVPAGTYVARVMATDSIGCSATAYLTINVGNGGATGGQPGGGTQPLATGQCSSAMCGGSSAASMLGLLVGVCGLKFVVRRRRQ